MELRELSAARAAVVGSPSPGPDLVVRLAIAGSGDLDSVQHFVNGRLTEWNDDSTTLVPLTIVYPEDHPAATLGIDAAGDLEIHRVLFRVMDETLRPVPPFDSVPPVLPRIPNATVSLQHHASASPAGDYSYFERFVDGQLIERSSGVLAEPDVTVWAPYLLGLRLRTGGADLREVLQGARVEGAQSDVELAAGILSSDSWQESERQLGRSSQLLYDYWLHASSLDHRARITRGAMRVLARTSGSSS